MELSRIEAEVISAAINEARVLMVRECRNLSRKRTDKVKHELQRRKINNAFEALAAFHESFKSQHRIGGY